MANFHAFCNNFPEERSAYSGTFGFTIIGVALITYWFRVSMLRIFARPVASINGSEYPKKGVRPADHSPDDRLAVSPYFAKDIL